MAAPDLTTPRRTSPLAALFGILAPDRLRNALPALIVAVSSGRTGLVLVVLGVVALVLGTLGWLRRLWSFDGRVLHLDEGVLVRNQRRIPVERIQHVELERSLRHQLFGLAAVRVETAGGSDAEVRLDAVPLGEAEALRTAVLASVAVAGPTADAAVAGEDTPPPAEILVRLPPGRLMLAGITGPEVLAVVAAVVFGLDALVDLGVDPERLDTVDLGRSALVLVIVAAVPLWFVVAGLIAVVRKWNLTATISGDRLRVTYGLLRKQEFVVLTGRVQDARVAQRLLLRPFGRADLRIRSAASGSGDAGRVDIPLLGDAEIDRVLQRVLPAAVPRPSLQPAPPGARRRAWVRGITLSAVLMSASGVLAATTSPWWLLAAVVLVPVGPVLGELAYRGLGWAEQAGVHHARSGTLARRVAIVPGARVQSAAVVSSLFQRRRDLASVRLDLAGAAVGIEDRATDQCREIVGTVTAR